MEMVELYIHVDDEPATDEQLSKLRDLGFIGRIDERDESIGWMTVELRDDLVKKMFTDPEGDEDDRPSLDEEIRVEGLGIVRFAIG